MVRIVNRLQRQRDNHLNRIAKANERELIQNYQIALKEVRTKLAALYETTNGSWIEAQKYNRLTNLEQQIAKEIGKLTGKNAQTLQKYLRETYRESYYYTGYILSNEVRADLGYSVLKSELVEEAIKNPLDRVGYLQRNRDNQSRLTRQLREQLTQGLIQGEAYGTTAKRLKQRLDVGASRAIRIAQTENHRVRSAGTLASMEQGEKAGIAIKKRWLATADGSTRDSHQELDGKTLDLDEDFYGESGSGPAPGMLGSASEDINCRCDMIEIVEGFEPNKRIVRDADIQPYKSYKEYKKEGLIS